MQDKFCQHVKVRLSFVDMQHNSFDMQHDYLAAYWDQLSVYHKPSTFSSYLSVNHKPSTFSSYLSVNHKPSTFSSYLSRSVNHKPSTFSSSSTVPLHMSQFQPNLVQWKFVYPFPNGDNLATKWLTSSQESMRPNYTSSKYILVYKGDSRSCPNLVQMVGQTLFQKGKSEEYEF